MAARLGVMTRVEVDRLRLTSFNCTQAGCPDSEGVQDVIRYTLGELLRSSPAAFVVAAVDGSTPAAIGVVVPTPIPLTMHLPVLAVQNAWTGRGLGRAIKIECALEARARGSTRLISSVHRDTAAMRHINDALPGVESEPEIGTAGIFYSVDLTDPGWAQFDRPSEA